MEKIEKIRKIYSVVISVFAVAMGIATICVAADIYYSAQGFPRDTVVQRLTALAIPFIVLIGAIAAGVIFPLLEVRAKPTSERGVKLLSAKLPVSGNGEEYDKAEQNYKNLGKYRLIVWSSAGAVTLGCTIAVLCYILNTKHFLSENITREIFRMVQHVLPWIAVAFAALIAATAVSGVFAAKQLKEIKTLLRLGSSSEKNAEPYAKGGAVARCINWLSSDLAVWIMRGIVFAVSVTFIILGVFNGGAHDVLIKAINICTECIGLG